MSPNVLRQCFRRLCSSLERRSECASSHQLGAQRVQEHEAFSDSQQASRIAIAEEGKPDSFVVRVGVGDRTFVNWKRLRTIIVRECIEAVSSKKDLSVALQRWDGMVGNRIIALVIDELKTSEAAFAMFKWSGQQYGYTHDAASYAALMKKLVLLENECEKTITVYKHLQRAEVRPDARVIGFLIQALCRLQRVDEAIEQLNATWEIVRDLRPGACIAILSALFNAGRPEDAYQFYKDLPRYDFLPLTCVVGNCMLQGLSAARRMGRALEIFQTMDYRDAASYIPMIQGYCFVDEPNQALKFVELMEKAQYFYGVATYVILINALERAGYVEEAYQCYLKMVRRRKSRQVFFPIVRILCSEGQGLGRLQQAYSVLTYAIHERHTPNGDFVYDFVLKAWEFGKEVWVEELFEYMARRRKRVDIWQCIDFIKRLCRDGKFGIALSLSKHLLWTGAMGFEGLLTVIRELCESGSSGEAYKFFKELQNCEETMTFPMSFPAETLSAILACFPDICVQVEKQQSSWAP